MSFVLFSAQKPYLFSNTWKTYFEPNQWLYDLRSNRSTPSPCTWRDAAYAIGDFLTWCESTSKSWANISDTDTKLYSNTLAHKPSTFNKRIRWLFGYYKWAKTNNLVQFLPFETRPRSNRHHPHSNLRFSRHDDSLEPTLLKKTVFNEDTTIIPAAAEFWRFATSLINDRDKLIAETFALTGMRISELLALQVAQINSIDIASPRGSFPILITGKGGKRRKIFFPRGLVIALQHWTCLQRTYLPHATSCPQLFIGRRGSLGARAIQKIFEAGSKACGIYIHPHLLRHFFAVHKLKWLTDARSPNPLDQLRRQLGHASIASTQIYLALTDENRIQINEDHASFIAAVSAGKPLSDIFGVDDEYIPKIMRPQIDEVLL